MIMICKNCGVELREGSTFCHECGFPVESQNGYYKTSYVLVSGTEINLEEKVDVYKKARSLLYESIVILVFFWVPLLPIIERVIAISNYREVCRNLAAFDNETNVVNIMLTERIRLTSFISMIISVVAMLSQIFVIILIIAIVGLASSISSFVGFGF